MDDPRIGFIGAGTLGSALALALVALDYRVIAVSSRTFSSARDLAGRIPGCRAVEGAQGVADLCDVAFITTPDEAIEVVATQTSWRPGQGVVHCGGAVSLDVLAPAAAQGAFAGSFHPFQTFACLDSAEQAVERLKGVTSTVEGTGWLLDFLNGLASRLGGQGRRPEPEDRALYHASAVMSCGYLVALLKAGTDIWREMGFSAEEALATVLPLAHTTLENLSRAGIEASLTGPLVRGDAATLTRHLEALESSVPGLLPLYCHLAQQSLPLVEDRIGPQRAHEISQLLVEHLSREGVSRRLTGAKKGRKDGPQSNH